MKKIFILFMVLAVAALSVSACGNSGNEKATTTVPAQPETVQETTQAAENTDKQTQEQTPEETTDGNAAEEVASEEAAPEETGQEPEAEPQEDTAAAEAGTLELTTINGTAWTLSYPSSFTYEEGASYQGGLGQKNETKRGILRGDFQIGICDGEVYPSAYESVEALNAQFKKSTIYEERELDGVAAYISQKGDSTMKVIIAYTDTFYICLNIISESGDYQAIYEGDVFNEILGSIAFSTDQEKEPLTSEKGYLTVTPVGAWYQGESKTGNHITLYNDSISSVSWIVFEDNQVTTPDKLKEYILVGFSNWSFETKTIGNNTFEVLDADNVAYLVAPTSTGKGIQIELWNVTLDQAMEVLETIEIK